MKPLRAILTILIGVSVYIGCSDVSFESQPNFECIEANEQYGDGSCVIANGTRQYDKTFKAGQVDILFVDDNSGSMYIEQGRMGASFPTLQSVLNGLDWRIAITTTDISASPGNSAPRAANGNGAYQDGKFLPFPNGKKVLKSTDSDAFNQFNTTIQRPETQICDSSGFTNCPSGDERGIYAVNMALDRKDSEFFRQDAHLAVIVLSDEDVRSNGGEFTGYSLQDYDKPKTLVSKVRAVFGPSKVMSFHSIIINPTDSQCFNEQNQQTNVKGFYGSQYASLSYPDSTLKDVGSIVDGYVGSICAPDYSSQMGDMADIIVDNVNIIQLECTPLAGSLQVSYSPSPGYSISVVVDPDNRVRLNPAPPANTSVRVKWKCGLYN